MWGWTSSITFFSSNFLVENRVEKVYKSFIASMYGANEINDHAFSFDDVLNMPFPLFYDYIDFQVKEKKKQITKQQNEMKKSMK